MKNSLLVSIGLLIGVSQAHADAWVSWTTITGSRADLGGEISAELRGMKIFYALREALSGKAPLLFGSRDAALKVKQLAEQAGKSCAQAAFRTF